MFFGESKGTFLKARKLLDYIEASEGRVRTLSGCLSRLTGSDREGNVKLGVSIQPLEWSEPNL